MTPEESKAYFAMWNQLVKVNTVLYKLVSGQVVEKGTTEQLFFSTNSVIGDHKDTVHESANRQRFKRSN